MKRELGFEIPVTTKTAVLSPDRKYRYLLGRRWLDGEGTVVFVMLNPSTADHRVDDRTIVRCMRFAQAWGYQGLEVVNLFAYRTPHPAQLFRAYDPVGPENDRYLLESAGRGDVVVCAWGAAPKAALRAEQVIQLLQKLPLKCLATTSAGAPRHPLYLSRTLRPQPFSPCGSGFKSV